MKNRDAQAIELVTRLLDVFNKGEAPSPELKAEIDAFLKGQTYCCGDPADCSCTTKESPNEKYGWGV